MPAINLPYGKDKFILQMEPEEILTIVKPHKLAHIPKSSAEAVKDALKSPIASPQLEEIVKVGEKVCLLVPDATRLWQSPAITIATVIARLNAAGITDKDITILCACGTHRRMTPAEHLELVGEEIVKRIKIVDHQCADNDEMRFLGTTTRGTPVLVNRHAVEADKIISLCGVVYHFLAGFGGGGKMILPGISSCETIQHNHKLALNKGFGSGINPGVRSGNISVSNPFHADILEAAEMLPPIFSVNVVTDENHNIIKAFAGDWKKAHLEACKLVEQLDGIKIPASSDLVIGSAGGFPKDINIYQGVKLFSNAIQAAKQGATLILLAKCPEGFGNEDCQRLVCQFDNMEEREKTLRDKFSIGAFAGYYCAQAGENYRLILVTDMDPALFNRTKLHIVSNLEDALKLAKGLNNDKPYSPAVIMPYGATTLPEPAK